MSIKLKKLLREYLIRPGDKLSSILRLNVFADIEEMKTLLDSWEQDGYDISKAKKLLERYKALLLPKLKFIQKNKNKPLVASDANKLEDSWYDGSDLYDDPDIFLSEIGSIYDRQLKTVTKVLSHYEY